MNAIGELSQIDVLRISVKLPSCESKLRWWLGNIGPCDGLVPSGNRPLPESTSTQIYVHIMNKASQSLLFTFAMVWFNGTFLYYSGQDAIDSTWKDKYPLYVFADGTIRWSFRGQSMSSCDLNMFKFPFDTQVCDLAFGNIVDFDEMINVTTKQDKVDFTFFIASEEFRYDVFITCCTQSQHKLKRYSHCSAITYTNACDLSHVSLRPEIILNWIHGSFNMCSSNVTQISSLIAKFMGPTWVPSGSCRP